jgi:hypothetical protein
LGVEGTPGEHHIIYVIRDPRDVALSGAHYYIFGCKRMRRVLGRVPFALGLFRRTLYRIVHPERHRVDKMMDAIICGSADAGRWSRVAWKSHIGPYLDSGALFVRYEDVLTSPERECGRLLDHLGLRRDADAIREAIERQSFAKKKSELVRKGEMRRAAFMRVGKSGQWKQRLTKRQKERFTECLSEELERFSYET